MTTQLEESQRAAIFDGSKPTARSLGRRSSAFAVSLLFGGVALVVLLYALSHPVYDFVEYWTAAHLLTAHHNPYSMGEMFRSEKPLGMNGPVPLMLLSPPWVLALIMPLGIVKSYIAGWLAWTGVLVLAASIASYLLMEVYYGELRIPEVSDKPFYRCLFAFTFYPLLLSFKFSQTAPLMLLGLAGFIYFESKQKPVWAGIFVSLTLIKPHLTYLLWVGLLLWSWRQGRWKLLISAAAFASFLLALALPFDIHIVQHYRELATSPYMELFPSGITWGLRMLLGGIGTFWIQFVPPAIGLAWFSGYWWRYRANWSWTERLPLVISISVLTSAYGWLFDQSLLVIPVIYLAAKGSRPLGRIPRSMVITYTVLNCAMMALWPLPSIGLMPAPIVLAVLLGRDSRPSELQGAVAASV
jgi:hypothetical protein